MNYERKRKESEWVAEQIEKELFEIARAKATCIPDDEH